MRLYSFTNMYTSGIHAGIQTAHVIHEMMRKYEKKKEKANSFLESDQPDILKWQALTKWADEHKTIIVKSAGYHQSLVDLYNELKDYSGFFKLPLGRWRESKDALNNAQTAVCIVVPKSIYDFVDTRMPTYPERPYATEWDQKAHELQKIINRYRMAS